MCVIGAGRMGQGIAASYLIAGLEVSLIDLKPRAADEQARVHDAARAAVRAELGMLARLGVLSEQADAALARLRLRARDDAAADLRAARAVFEAVPERLDAKRDAALAG